MLSYIRVLLAALFYLAASHIQAVEINHIKINDSFKSKSGEKLILNGAGIRSKFIFDVYIGALYLSEKTNSVEQVLANEKSRVILMHFLYDEIDKKKLTDGWTDGFKNNSSESEYKAISSRINEFNDLFTDVVKNDRIVIELHPDNQTSVIINGQVRGQVEGQQFQRALLKIWLGEEPADDDLKNAMLGKTEE